VSWSPTYFGPKFHAALADFPYGLHFMNAKWDDPKQITRSQVVRYLPSGQAMTTVQENIEYQNAARQWGEAILPHLFPGALIFVFAGPRMWEWVATGMQMAGFEHWDTMMWLYGSGFPKGMNIDRRVAKFIPETKQVYGNAWQDYKTPALKPAWEPILCFRAPRCGMTYSELALRYGTGALNIGGCRIGDDVLPEAKAGKSRIGTFIRNGMVTPARKGRYAANLLIDEESAFMMEAQKIGASRFFYCAKASSKERNAGLDGIEPQTTDDGRNIPIDNPFQRGKTLRRNNHPTVKPLALCRYLATLLLPPASVAPRRLWVPFAGSGSEMIGAMQAGWDEIIGIEQDADFCEIAKLRLQHWRMAS
jgi:DNA methylase